jgi:8-oxo-dGTP pyrophosphatase MutT (NUDIX family)
VTYDERERASSAPRRALTDPRRFLIPEASLPPGFAERVEGRRFEPAPTRPAATVVLVREAEEMEVLLLRRPMRSGFAAGAWVFPGGRVDRSDSEPGLAGLLGTGSGASWAGRLGLADASDALGYVVAALREAWEETGIVIGDATADATRLAEVRRALLAGELEMAEAVRRAGLRFDLSDLLYVAHWITPEPEPRRYDTRFFLARVGECDDCVLEGEELSESRWVSPRLAVEAFQSGEMMLLPPTVDTLRRLAGFRGLDAAWAELRDAPVPRILPRMVRDPLGVIIEF